MTPRFRNAHEPWHTPTRFARPSPAAPAAAITLSQEKTGRTPTEPQPSCTSGRTSALWMQPRRTSSQSWPA
jgi:hypothetical protein